MTAVAPVVIRGNGLWVGWSGIQLTSEEEPIPESDPSDQTPTAGLKSSQVGLEFYTHKIYNILIYLLELLPSDLFVFMSDSLFVPCTHF